MKSKQTYSDMLAILNRINSAYQIREGDDQSVMKFMDAMDSIASDMRAVLSEANGGAA